MRAGSPIRARLHPTEPTNTHGRNYCISHSYTQQIFCLMNFICVLIIIYWKTYWALWNSEHKWFKRSIILCRRQLLCASCVHCKNKSITKLRRHAAIKISQIYKTLVFIWRFKKFTLWTDAFWQDFVSFWKRRLIEKMDWLCW